MQTKILAQIEKYGRLLDEKKIGVDRIPKNIADEFIEDFYFAFSNDEIDIDDMPKKLFNDTDIFSLALAKAKDHDFDFEDIYAKLTKKQCDDEDFMLVGISVSTMVLEWVSNRLLRSKNFALATIQTLLESEFFDSGWEYDNGDYEGNFIFDVIEGYFNKSLLKDIDIIEACKKAEATMRENAWESDYLENDNAIINGYDDRDYYDRTVPGNKETRKKLTKEEQEYFKNPEEFEMKKQRRLRHGQNY